MSNEDILDFKQWWPDHFKKLPGSVENNKIKFGISKYRHFIFNSDTVGMVTTALYIDSYVKSTFKISKRHRVDLPTTKAYRRKVPIKQEKINDLQKVIQYVPEQFLPFYQARLTWPTTEAADENEDDD